MGALDRRAPTTTLTITQLTVWRLWTVFCSVVKNALLAVHFLSREGAGVGTPPPPPEMTWGFLIPSIYFLITGILQNMAICMTCILSSSHYVIA